LEISVRDVCSGAVWRVTYRNARKNNNYDYYDDHIKEDAVGWACGTHGTEKKLTQFWCETFKETT
jgi:hypothetical protein